MSHIPSPVIRDAAAVTPQPVERTRGTAIQILIGPADGAPNFMTRRFTIDPGGRIPRHPHDTIEHEQVMLAGTMTNRLDPREVDETAGVRLLIPAGVALWYDIRSDEPVAVLGMVPFTSVYQTEWLEPPEM